MATLSWAAFVAFCITTVVLFFSQRKLLKDIERFRREHEKQQRAQIVAELLALWGHTGTTKMSEDTRKKLNELSFQCSLWLPVEILQDLSLRLTNQHGSKEAKEILSDVRVHLGNDRIDPGLIVHF
ncbi:MAG: hypothetical protein ACO1OO_07185 [Flavisolibacter sp.]